MLRGRKSSIQLCTWKLDWAHDREALWASASAFVTRRVHAVCGNPKSANKKTVREAAADRRSSLHFPTPASSSASLPWSIHVPLACLESENAALDARHTHTRFSSFLVHTRAVNIDMVCELSAALLCLCKKYKSLCKKFANFFSLLRLLASYRHRYTERFRNCCCPRPRFDFVGLRVLFQYFWVLVTMRHRFRVITCRMGKGVFQELSWCASLSNWLVKSRNYHADVLWCYSKRKRSRGSVKRTRKFSTKIQQTDQFADKAHIAGKPSVKCRQIST